MKIKLIVNEFGIVSDSFLILPHLFLPKAQ